MCILDALLPQAVFLHYSFPQNKSNISIILARYNDNLQMLPLNSVNRISYYSGANLVPQEPTMRRMEVKHFMF